MRYVERDEQIEQDKVMWLHIATTDHQLPITEHHNSDCGSCKCDQLVTERSEKEGVRSVPGAAGFVRLCRWISSSHFEFDSSAQTMQERFLLFRYRPRDGINGLYAPDRLPPEGKGFCSPSGGGASRRSRGCWLPAPLVMSDHVQPTCRDLV